MNYLDRVRSFLRAYPNDGSTNLHPDRIYTYWANGIEHQLTWSDLDALCRAAESVEQ